MINSISKGKRGERLFCTVLTKCGFPYRRGQQFKGGNDSADVEPNLNSQSHHVAFAKILHEMIHFEVKNYKRINTKTLRDILDTQAAIEAEGKTAIIAYKMNGCNWQLFKKDNHSGLHVSYDAEEYLSAMHSRITRNILEVI
jgi:hypothetical protein